MECEVRADGNGRAGQEPSGGLAAGSPLSSFAIFAPSSQKWMSFQGMQQPFYSRGLKATFSISGVLSGGKERGDCPAL